LAGKGNFGTHSGILGEGPAESGIITP